MRPLHSSCASALVLGFHAQRLRASGLMVQGLSLHKGIEKLFERACFREMVTALQVLRGRFLHLTAKARVL